MRGESRQFGVRVWACCAMVGAAGVAGLLGGLSMRASQSSHVRTEVSLSATEAVSFRFPNVWHDTEAADEETQTTAATQPEPAPARYAVASAGSVPVSFNRKPTAEAVTLKSAEAPKPVEQKPAEQEAVMAPPWVMAVQAPLPRPRPKTAPADSVAAAATTASQTTASHAAAAPAVPAKAAAVHKPKSNAVLNSAQLASIKRRLNLSPDQERYWPAVEAELRKMEYAKRSPAGATRTASVDMSKVNVEGLKSAGYPLVMSFSDDQRRELRSLAHLLGLESVMSGI